MTIKNTKVVDIASKYIVKSTGIGSETDQIMVDAEKLTGATNESLVSLIECYYLIEGTGTLKIGASSETNDLSLTTQTINKRIVEAEKKIRANNILPEEADNYNSFYNDIIQSENSSITTVFNADPSIVKIFNTINYEGDQARILKPGSEFLVNTNNALAWYQNQDIDGWYCEHVTTNLSSGTVREFIKKEGKWFNYIQGQSLSTDTIDTSRFSVQGLGVVESIEIIS